MRRRIDIAASLVTQPEILFLDEPTTGLDPRSRNQVWDLVRQIAADGTTVLLTTQYLEEADRLAERLAVIDHGRVIAEGTSRDLKASVGSNALHFRLAEPGAARAGPGRGLRPAGRRRAAADRSVVVHGQGGGRVAGAPTCWARFRGRASRLVDFSLGAPSLDDVFFALTGRPGGEARPHYRAGDEGRAGGVMSADAIVFRRSDGQRMVMRARARPARRAVRRRHPRPGARC